MSRKPKLRPRITSVRLNPEQAVLQRHCYSHGYKQREMGAGASVRMVLPRGEKFVGFVAGADFFSSSSYALLVIRRYGSWRLTFNGGENGEVYYE